MPTLNDHRGEPVSTDDLEREHAKASIASVRSPYRQGVASTLTPARLGRLLRAADEGDVESFLALADEMEERELHYRSVLTTRKLSITGKPVIVEAASETPRDIEIADAVRELVSEPAFEDLLFDALDGLGKGFSVVEILWDTKRTKTPHWRPRSYAHRDARHFRWDVETFSELRLLDDSAPSLGVPLAPFKYVVHKPKLKTGLPIRGGLARVAAAAYMLKSFTLRDWHAFMEVFGMPLRVGRYGNDATEEERNTLLRAVSNIAFDAAAIIPESMKIDFVEASKASGGQTLFQGAADWWDKQVSKVVLGQTMTSDDGASMAQAKVHDDVKDDITKADCRQLMASIVRDLIRPFIDLNWGPQEVYPKVRFEYEDTADQEAASRTVKTLAEAGVLIPMWWVRDRFGIPEPEAGDETIGGKPASFDLTPPPASNARAMNAAQEADAIDRIAQEALADWQPLLDGNVGALLRLAKQATTFDGFKALLAASADELDINDVTESLALAVFKARGLGDATDAVT